MIREDLSQKEVLDLMAAYEGYFLGIRSRAVASAKHAFQLHPTDKFLYEQSVFYISEMLALSLWCWSVPIETSFGQLRLGWRPCHCRSG